MATKKEKKENTTKKVEKEARKESSTSTSKQSSGKKSNKAVYAAVIIAVLVVAAIIIYSVSIQSNASVPFATFKQNFNNAQKVSIASTYTTEGQFINESQCFSSIIQIVLQEARCILLGRLELHMPEQMPPLLHTVQTCLPLSM